MERFKIMPDEEDETTKQNKTKQSTNLQTM